MTSAGEPPGCADRDSMDDTTAIVARPVLGEGGLVLRPPRPSDKQDRFNCGTDPEFVRMRGGDYRDIPPLTREDVDRWYAHLCREPHVWVIAADDRCIGAAGIDEIASHARRARYVIHIYPRALWGRGLGTQVTRLILAHAFETLGLHRVDLRVLSYNARAITCYKKCGFIEEGVERDSALVADKWESDVMMSILEAEYRAAAIHW